MRQFFAFSAAFAILGAGACIPESSPDLLKSRPPLKSGAGTVVGEEDGAIIRVPCELTLSQSVLASVSDPIWNTQSRIPTRVGETVSTGNRSFTLTRLDYSSGGIVIGIHGEYTYSGQVEVGDAQLEVHTLTEGRTYFHLQRSITSASGMRQFDGMGSSADISWGFPDDSDSLFRVVPPRTPRFTGTYAGVFVGPTTVADETLDESMIVNVSFDEQGRLVQVTDFAGGRGDIVVDQDDSHALRYVDYGAAHVDIYLQSEIVEPGLNEPWSEYSLARLRLNAAEGGVSGEIARTTSRTFRWIADWRASATLDRPPVAPDFSGTYTGTLSAPQTTRYAQDGRVVTRVVSLPVSFSFDEGGRLRRLTFAADLGQASEVDYDHEEGGWSGGMTFRALRYEKIGAIRHLPGAVLISAIEESRDSTSQTNGSEWQADYRIWREGDRVRCGIAASYVFTSVHGGDDRSSRSTWAAESDLSRAAP